jgi:hypothetical protein
MLWSRCVAALHAVARDLPDSMEAASATVQADRIAKGRARFSTAENASAAIKTSGRGAETSTTGETP